MSWLRPHELRVGLGCMRLDAGGAATVEAAVNAGITIFGASTAHRALAGALGATYVHP